jgi:hypothetical protein
MKKKVKVAYPTFNFQEAEEDVEEVLRKVKTSMT